MKRFLTVFVLCMLFCCVAYGADNVENTLSSEPWIVQNNIDLVKFKGSKANFAVDARNTGAGVYNIYCGIP